MVRAEQSCSLHLWLVWPAHPSTANIPDRLLLFGLDGYQLRCFVVARRCAGALAQAAGCQLSAIIWALAISRR